jgi:hypothetical protein
MIIVLMATGIGCSDKNSVPSGILAREDMQNILWDMVQADQYSAYLAKDSARVNLKLENMRLYDQVFQLHHISREKFTKSYKYYMAHPELTQTLMDSLLAMGNRIRTENYNRPIFHPVSTPPLTTVPVQPAPGQKTPAQTMPTQKNPTQKAPAQSAPGAKPPAQPAAAQPTPAQAAPAGGQSLPKLPRVRTREQRLADSLRKKGLSIQ